MQAEAVGTFPLEKGTFKSLVVSGATGLPTFATPDNEHNGRLAVSGDLKLWEGEKTLIPGSDQTAAVIAEQRKLIVIGDADVEQGDPYISAGWSETIHLQPDSAPVVLGWRVRYVAGGFMWSDDQGRVSTSGPTFGFTTEANLTTNVTTGSVIGVIRFAPTESRSAVFCLAGIREQVGLACKSSSKSSASDDVPRLSANDAGGFDYDVLIAFDSANREVRACVGWGTTGARVDKVSVPFELWPSPELPLVPFVSLVCEDFCGMSNISDAAQLPISFEALTREQIADDALQALLQVGFGAQTVEVATLDEAEAVSGFWLSEMGQCRIYNDQITQKLCYEELIGDGSERLHGWLEPIAKKNGVPCWQAELMILEEDDGPWYGPSCGEKPEVVGSIKVTLLADSQQMATQTKTEDDADWQPRTIFNPAKDDDA
mmetsp:Transcript_29316/g.62336  ORF Transcript_29316/g.62336 Transcript_29316/m.62336 type:complete len:430 (+) Transcript_29316:101-1390(+)